MKGLDMNKIKLKEFKIISTEEVLKDIDDEVNVGWTPSHQSYYSAGDEAEAYCLECDQILTNDDWNYCPNCGIELVWRKED